MAEKKAKATLYTGTGRRKTAVASVWLYEKKGEIMVNDVLIKDYFDNREATLEWVKPFHAVGVSHPQSKFSATIKVHGGGTTGHIDAVKLAIARALLQFDPEFRAILRSSGLLTRDARAVERKKPFFRKSRKKPQYSKR